MRFPFVHRRVIRFVGADHEAGVGDFAVRARQVARSADEIDLAAGFDRGAGGPLRRQFRDRLPRVRGRIVFPRGVERRARRLLRHRAGSAEDVDLAVVRGAAHVIGEEGCVFLLDPRVCRKVVDHDARRVRRARPGREHRGVAADQIQLVVHLDRRVLLGGLRQLGVFLRVPASG